MNAEDINISLESILEKYKKSFNSKDFDEESLEEDDLMLVFGLTQTIKSENKQYWGRELGMCWQLLVTEIFKNFSVDYQGAIREGKDEICDLVVNKDAIDTKYRIGSGDSGTLKKFKQYGEKLKQLNYRPVLLILRNDSLPQALKACETGGWVIQSGSQSYQYIYDLTQFDLQLWLRQRKNNFSYHV